MYSNCFYGKFCIGPYYFFRSFFQLVGDLGELQDKVYTDLVDKPKGKDSKEFIAQPSVECQDIELDDLEVVATLGIGGFGRVELVKVTIITNVDNRSLCNYSISVSRPSIQHICLEVSEKAPHCRNSATGTCFLREEYYDVL